MIFTLQHQMYKSFIDLFMYLLISEENDKHLLELTRFLSVVLYGCESWSLTLREEMKLRVSENMVLRRIFGPRRDVVTGGM